MTTKVSSNLINSIATSQLTGTISGAQLASGAANTNLGFTPYNSTNPSGYQTSSGGVTTFSSTTQNSQFNSIGINTAASGTAGEIMRLIDSPV